MKIEDEGRAGGAELREGTKQIYIKKGTRPLQGSRLLPDGSHKSQFTTPYEHAIGQFTTRYDHEMFSEFE